MMNTGRVTVLTLSLLVACTSCESTKKHAPATAPAATAPTTQAIDPVIARIRAEGLENSQVMETLDYLTNVIGPRLTGSPNGKWATDWTRDRLASWGLSNAHLEPWGPFGRGWSVDGYSFQVTEPAFFVPIAYPRAWSPSFEGKGVEIVYLDAQEGEDLDAYKGKLEGKIVLIGLPREPAAHFEPLAQRHSDADLQKLADFKPGDADDSPRGRRRRGEAATAPTTGPATPASGPSADAATTAPADELLTAATTTPTTRRARSTTAPVDPRNDPFTLRKVAFAAEEKAAVIVTASSKGDGSTMFVQQATIPGDPPRGSPEATTRPRVWADDAPPVPPQLTMAIEHYNRLVRVAERGITIRADLHIVTTEHGKGVMPDNVVAEIPGGDLADEIVMVGGHLDSWHSGSGATDNAVGAACAMEAVRILKALDLKPRRTIRVALWTGEEQGLFGSNAYVKEHFGYVEKDEPATQPSAQPTTQPTQATTQSTTQEAPIPVTQPTSAPTTQPATTNPAPRPLIKLAGYETLSVYFNLDNGAGRIRGIYAQGNEAAVPLFRAWLTLFADLGAQTVTLQNTGSTDHIPFDTIGLPGFQFIQDPLEYGTRTHHSSMDVYDRIQADDARQASTIMAAFLWNAANLPERFPRKAYEAK